MRRRHYSYLVDRILQVSKRKYDKDELQGTCFVSIAKVSVCFKIREVWGDYFLYLEDFDLVEMEVIVDYE